MTKSSIRTVAGADEGFVGGGQMLRHASSARVAGLLFTVASALCCGGRETQLTQEPAGRTSGGNTSSTSGAGSSAPGQTTSVGGVITSGGSGAITSGGSGAITSVTSGGNGAITSGGSGGAIEPAGGSTSLAGSGSGQQRIAQVRGQPAWVKLRDLWRQLDDVMPTASNYSPYASTITVEQRDQWIAELAAGLGAMQSTGLLTETELLFLRELATARIQVMHDGGYHYEMFLHRAPELFEGQTENSIVRIEQKLDVLETLRAKCLVDAEPYRLALEQVEREATVFFIMDQLMLSSGTTRIKLTLPTDLWGEALAQELDQRLATLAADPSTTEVAKTDIAALRARLEVIQSSLVSLPALLQEFERCE